MMSFVASYHVYSESYGHQNMKNGSVFVFCAKFSFSNVGCAQFFIITKGPRTIS